jgi:hypothetical protein
MAAWMKHLDKTPGPWANAEMAHNLFKRWPGADAGEIMLEGIWDQSKPKREAALLKFALAVARCVNGPTCQARHFLILSQYVLRCDCRNVFGTLVVRVLRCMRIQ